jgi:hypothetical protein
MQTVTDVEPRSGKKQSSSPAFAKAIIRCLQLLAVLFSFLIDISSMTDISPKHNRQSPGE